MQYAKVYQADTLARLDAERGLVALERRRLIAERQEETGESGKRVWFWGWLSRDHVVGQSARAIGRARGRGLVAR